MTLQIARTNAICLSIRICLYSRSATQDWYRRTVRCCWGRAMRCCGKNISNSHGSSEAAPHERVFVFFGGSDPQNLTGAALSALSFPRLRHLSVDIVVGVNNPHSAQLQRQCTDRSGTTLYDARPHLADLMARADLAIGAAGTTTWERMCLGLPSLVVSIAKNQRPAAEA